MEDFQSWKSVIENIYFPCHTLKFRKLSLWKGKSTVRTVCTTNFRSVRKYFDEYFDGLICNIYKNWYETQPDLLMSLLLTMDDLADNRLSWVVLDFFKRSLLVSFLDVFMFIIFWQYYYVKYIFLSKKWKAQLF